MEVYRSPESQSKIERIQTDGLKNLQIITDFDGTLTYEVINGQKIPTSIALLRNSNLLSAEYSTQAHALFAKYHPYEKDNTLNPGTKKNIMLQWWQTHLELIIKSGVTEQILDQIITENQKLFRKEIDTFLKFLDQNDVPLLVLSAGIGNMVEKLLQKHSLYYPNIHIISNFFTFDKNGVTTGYNSKIIHSYNKDETAILDSTYYKEITNRKNVILLGNSIGDTSMSEGVDHDVVLKIGFLDEPNKDDSELILFKEVYDIVITGEGDLTTVNEVLDQIVLSAV